MFYKFYILYYIILYWISVVWIYHTRSPIFLHLVSPFAGTRPWVSTLTLPHDTFFTLALSRSVDWTGLSHWSVFINQSYHVYSLVRYCDINISFLWNTKKVNVSPLSFSHPSAPPPHPHSYSPIQCFDCFIFLTISMCRGATLGRSLSRCMLLFVPNSIQPPPPTGTLFRVSRDTACERSCVCLRSWAFAIRFCQHRSEHNTVQHGYDSITFFFFFPIPFISYALYARIVCFLFDFCLT